MKITAQYCGRLSITTASDLPISAGSLHGPRRRWLRHAPHLPLGARHGAPSDHQPGPGWPPGLQGHVQGTGFLGAVFRPLRISL